MAQQSYYFDYAAATPVDEEVLKAMMPYFVKDFYNPSAIYLAAKGVSGDIIVARTKVATILGVKPSEIIFTAGGTEADNLAINGVMQLYPDSNVVVSGIEHDAVLEAVKAYDNKILPVDKSGQALVDSTLTRLIDDKTVLVSIMYANNEVGAIQPLHRIKQQIDIIKQERLEKGNTLPLYFHTDASQAPNYLDIHAHRLGVDLMTINGGKIYGPKQTGVLFVASHVRLKPQLVGGGQERKLRSGTENVPGIIGLSKALDIAQSIRKDESKRLATLQQVFINELQTNIPTVIINSKHALPNFIHISIPGVDNERLIMELDERGIQAAVGSACSASSDEPSHVLKAMGISDKLARSSLRFTMGRSTNESAVRYVVSVLTDVCGALTH